MQRNTLHRVETLVPIKNPTVHEQILGQIMQGNIKDEALSWVLHSDMTYTRVSESPQAFSCHQFFMTHPSLSGRGSAKLRATVARQKKAVRREERATAKVPEDTAPKKKAAAKPEASPARKTAKGTTAKTKTTKTKKAKIPLKQQKKIVMESVAPSTAAK